MTVYIVGPRDRVRLNDGDVLINTTSRSDHWRDLSPFYLGPCKLYGEFWSRNVENGWQFSKVYKEHADPNGNPTDDYWMWAMNGWQDDYARRYPMGKGAVPLYSLWDGEKLGYIEARKKIYIPLYSDAVRNTDAYDALYDVVKSSNNTYLWDFDGYDYLSLGMTLNDVVNDPTRKMGHAFVLAMMMEGVLP